MDDLRALNGLITIFDEQWIIIKIIITIEIVDKKLIEYASENRLILLLTSWGMTTKIINRIGM